MMPRLLRQVCSFTSCFLQFASLACAGSSPKSNSVGCGTSPNVVEVVARASGVEAGEVRLQYSNTITNYGTETVFGSKQVKGEAAFNVAQNPYTIQPITVSSSILETQSGTIEYLKKNKIEIVLPKKFKPIQTAPSVDVDISKVTSISDRFQYARDELVKHYQALGYEVDSSKLKLAETYLSGGTTSASYRIVGTMQKGGATYPIDDVIRLMVVDETIAKEYQRQAITLEYLREVKVRDASGEIYFDAVDTVFDNPKKLFTVRTYAGSKFVPNGEIKAIDARELSALYAELGRRDLSSLRKTEILKTLSERGISSREELATHLRNLIAISRTLHDPLAEIQNTHVLEMVTNNAPGGRVVVTFDLGKGRNVFWAYDKKSGRWHWRTIDP